MGADLIIEWIIVPDGDKEKLKKEMLNKINVFTKKAEKDRKTVEDLLKFFEEEGSVIKADRLEEIEKELIKTITEVLDHNWRDTTWIEHKGDIILLTGGMCWGDNPTESFEDYRKFNLIENYFYEEKK